MRIIVAGGRKFDDYDLVRRELDNFLKDKDKSDIEIISGRAIGADRLGERYAEEHALNCVTFEAQWFKLGKRAGIVRNGQMELTTPSQFLSNSHSHLKPKTACK